MKAGQYNLRKGVTRVIIFAADKKKFIGEGVYVGFKPIEFWDIKINSPKFRLLDRTYQGKRIIYGYQCWWILKSETKQTTPPDYWHEKRVPACLENKRG